MTQTVTVYRGGTIFTGDAHAPLTDALAVAHGRVLAIGDEASVLGTAALEAAGGEVTQVDLAGKFVSPGIVESHTHMLMFGQSVEKVPLRGCESLAEIQQALREARLADPNATQILGLSWRFEALKGSDPTAAMIDEIISDVPVILEANDLHSAWVNTAALAAMGITRDTPNPVGGEIRRDENGDATGFLLETAAMQYGWEFLAATVTDADRDRFLRNAFQVYLASGVTAAVEMALGETELATFERMIEREGRLPFPMAAHVILTATGDREVDLAQIARVVELRERVRARKNDDTFAIIGVKFILDGVIDACTAAMRDPYANGDLPCAIWDREAAIAVALAADAAELQLALHAIGDAASELALDMIEACVREHGEHADRRPRVEHLEYATQDTIERMAALGVTASMQPVHCDPAIMDNWKAMLGDERAEQGFLWQAFRSAGVPVALGTDAPTAPHEALDNLYIALTAGSVLEASRDPYHPERVFTPAEGLEAMTSVGAETAGFKGLGTLRQGARANFVVLDTNILSADPGALRDAVILETYVDGESVYRAP